MRGRRNEHNVDMVEARVVRKITMSKLSYGFASALAVTLAVTGCARGGAPSKGDVRPEPGRDTTVLAHPALTQVGVAVSIED